MRHFVGMDLHSNNTVVGIINENDVRVFKKKLPNELSVILRELEPYRATIEAIAVESTSAQSNICVMRCLGEQINIIEKKALKTAKLSPQFRKLLSISGIGNILALTIALETGDINRFEDDGNYASYCRCVKNQRDSNGKKKGENNMGVWCEADCL